MFKNIKSVSAPIILSDEMDVKPIETTKKVFKEPKNVPKEIIEYNNKANNIFVSPFLLHELIDFKTRNAMVNDSLKENPTIEVVIHEYKVAYRRKLRGQFNKLTINSVIDTVNFINNNTNNILNENEMNEFIMQRLKNDLLEKMKLPIITAYALVIKELEQSNKYHFDFKFNKEFLNDYRTYDDIDNKIFDVMMNLVNLIVLLYDIKLIDDEEVFTFFDEFVFEPELIFNMNLTTYSRLIMNIIHGTPNGDAKFKPGIINQIFLKYLKEREGKVMIENYKKLIEKHGSSFLSKMLIEMLENMVDGKICCQHCEMRIKKYGF